MNEELDRDLLALFRETAAEPADEPFRSRNAELIRHVRRRRALVGWSLRIIGIVVVAAVSPWLVGASEWLSVGLGAAFAAAESFLGTGWGMFAAAAVALPVIVLNRKRLL